MGPDGSDGALQIARGQEFAGGWRRGRPGDLKSYPVQLHDQKDEHGAFGLVSGPEYATAVCGDGVYRLDRAYEVGERRGVLRRHGKAGRFVRDKRRRAMGPLRYRIQPLAADTSERWC